MKKYKIIFETDGQTFIVHKKQYDKIYNLVFNESKIIVEKHICPDCESKEVERLTNNPYGTDRYKCELCNTEWDELTG